MKMKKEEEPISATAPKKDGAPERHQQPPFRSAIFCPADAVLADFHVPPKVERVATWDGLRSSNEGMT
jgi:hypothetical protein